MARRSRNRYREMENLMTKIILADVLVFILYLLCAGLGWTVLKVITAIIAIIGSGYAPAGCTSPVNSAADAACGWSQPLSVL